MLRTCLHHVAFAILLGLTCPSPGLALATLGSGKAGPRTTSAMFVQNDGQLSGPARLYALGEHCAVFFEPHAVWLDRRPDRPGASGVALRLDFPAADNALRLVAASPGAGRVNDLRGPDPRRWRAGLTSFAEARYEGIAPGADLVFRVSGGQLKYDIRLAPGADLSRVVLRYHGADAIAVGEAGELRVQTAAGELIENAPTFHQDAGRNRIEIEGGYRLISSREVGFWVRSYDPALPLVVDPALRWSTFLGGAGADYAGAVTSDAVGDLYVVGATLSADYPTTPGAYQRGKGADRDVFVTRLAGDGTTLRWSTFLGGNGTDNGLAIALDAGGNVLIAGSTASTDFPTTSGALRRTYAGGTSDGFAAKLSPAGSALGYSTYLGGSANDLALAIAVDAAGNASVAGYTRSTDFPTTPGVVKPSRTGSLFDVADGFVSKLDAAGSRLVYSTYVGAEGGTDEVLALALDGQGRATVAGMTQSANFPTTPGVFGRSFGAHWDGFVARLDATGSAYVYSTLLPGSGYDEPWGVALDATGAAYVTGRTWSTDFPTSANAPQRVYGGGSYDAFVTKIAPDASAIVYSTFAGGMGSEQGTGIVVAPSGVACITGWSDAVDYPVTPEGFDTSPNGGPDAFVTCVSSAGASFTYSSFIGGSGADLGRGVAVLPNLDLAIAGYTASPEFPATAQAYDPTQNSPGVYDAFVSVLDAGLAANVGVEGGEPAPLALAAPFPNPFRDQAVIRLSLERATSASVRIFDIQGRHVRTLEERELPAGAHRWVWDGRDERGASCASGVYYVTAIAGGERRVAPVLRVH